jgi:hypothetical protein
MYFQNMEDSFEHDVNSNNQRKRKRKEVRKRCWDPKHTGHFMGATALGNKENRNVGKDAGKRNRVCVR